MTGTLQKAIHRQEQQEAPSQTEPDAMRRANEEPKQSTLQNNNLEERHHPQPNQQQEKRLDLPTKQTLLKGGVATELVWEQYKSASYHASKI